MHLGEKLRLARQEAGLSQRELCGDRITRNMLSQIENGSASPSVSTLRFLAQRLGKPVSFFLEEETVTSPSQAVMQKARQAFEEKKYEMELRDDGYKNIIKYGISFFKKDCFIKIKK